MSSLGQVALGEQPIQHRLPRVPEAIESVSETSATALKDQYSPLDTFAERNSRTLLPEELNELTSVRENLPLSPMTLNTTNPESPSKEGESSDASTPLFSDHTSDHNWQEKSSSEVPLPFSYDMQMSLDENNNGSNVSLVPMLIVAPPDSFAGESPFVPAPAQRPVETDEEANPDLLTTPVPSPTQSAFSNPFVTSPEQQLNKPTKSATADGTSAETFMTESVSSLARTSQVSGSSIKAISQPGLFVNYQQT
eukprot:Em0006g889a